MKDLKGKVAVVTGAASGIGKAMAERFAQADMKLALADIEKAPLDGAAHALESGGAEVLPQIVDVGQADAMDRFRDAVLDRFGAVHVVCNNAGVGSAGTIWELDTADWEFTLGPNLWGVIHGVRVFAPLLVEQDEGHVVNTASMAGLVSMGGMGAYNVTKQGVVALSETLFMDLEAIGSKVGVSVLCPGFVSTQIWNAERYRPKPSSDDESDPGQAARREALKSIIESGMPPEQVAERVHRAIVENHLYILTHEATGPLLEKRIRHIVNGENPTALPADEPIDLTR